MTLEQLKAALEEALTKLKASPDDAKAKQAVADAQQAYDDAVDAEAAAKAAKGGEGDPATGDDPKWDEKTKAYIKKLRDEAATHRTKSKELGSKLKTTEEQKKAILKAAGIEVEDDKPEEQVKVLSATNQTLSFRTAVLESALEHGIPKDQLDFYEFLLSKALAELKDGEELPEEKLTEIVGKCKPGGKGSANSTVTGGKGGGGTPPAKTGEITLDQFCRMTMTEKSNLYIKSPDVYKVLWDEAKAKKRI